MKAGQNNIRKIRRAKALPHSARYKPVIPLLPNGRGLEMALELLEINLALKRAIRDVNPHIVR